MHTEWGKSHSALHVNMFPLVSSEFCVILYVIHCVSHCFALILWRNVLYYLSIRHVIYLLCNNYINVKVESSLSLSGYIDL